jgi:putative heme-binding domain-containing protein
MRRGKFALPLAGIVLCVLFAANLTARLESAAPKEPSARAQPVPHGQDFMPGPPLSPAEAIAKMKVPEGFHVELVAAEPDLVNPVAMTFDERGRIWVTESLEYPRQAPGIGRDRVKVLEDTDGDGKIDKVTIFAEGLNIPSGIAVGHGGIWVANSPDILFFKIGPDGKAAGKPEVVVTGFGRDDTHELPNSLTWGPDGWLYGLNGVFNRSVVRQNGKTFDFTCALFRIHPRTHEFQIFCEGTSNPWGVAFDSEGSAFVSACVIDHLWHLSETGYYLRQGGPYPPYTWILPSIVKHRHQKAAYCGIHYFDSDAYPPEYRGKLYMGNIHGNCINCDELTRDGATYFAKTQPDFLSANDAWFMPVSQKTGPDGCLYVLDWYDRYHCYQDANRDPAGIDRLRGRLYRIRYKDTPRAPKFDLAHETDDQLIQRLHSPNVFYRDLAQRLLCERNTAQVREGLRKLVLDEAASRKARMHALWALVGTGTLEADFHRQLLEHKDPGVRAWGVRAAGSFRNIDAPLRERLIQLATDPSPDVKLQVAIAARKVEGLDAMAVLLDVLSSCSDDKLIPGIVWQNLHPLLENKADAYLQAVAQGGAEKRTANLMQLLPRALERILGSSKVDAMPLARAFALLAEGEHPNLDAARQVLTVLSGKVQSGELRDDGLAALREAFRPIVLRLRAARSDHPLRLDAAIFALTLRELSARDEVRAGFIAPGLPEGVRLRALEALIAARQEGVLETAASVVKDVARHRSEFRGQVLGVLGRLDNPKVAELVLDAYPRMEPDLRPRAIELLSQRPIWGKQLMQAVADKKVPAAALNVNQARRLLASKDPTLVKQVQELYGTVREARNPEREKVVAQMRDFLHKTPGDARAGVLVFKNLCGQCHKIYGEGQDVGPDVTSNGRSSFDQLLSNVFDPSLVIGAGYQATTVMTKSGRSVTGLLAEDSPRRIVLKTQGGKLEIIARSDVDEVSVSPVSLMPEGVENQLKPKEIADLFAFLTLDRPPAELGAKKIPGAP